MQQQPQWGAHRPWYADYFGNNWQLIQQIQGWFYAIDTDRSGNLDQGELGRALQQAQLNFTPAVLTRLMKAFDLDHSGKLSVNEFVCLYQFVLAVHNAFFTMDRDRSGKLDNWNEIGLALNAVNFPLSQYALNSVLGRFDPTRKGLTLDAFTELTLFLASLKSFFGYYQSQAPVAVGGPGGHGPATTGHGGPGGPGPAIGHGGPGGPGPATGPHAPPASHGAPVSQHPAQQTISINFDQFVCATPYFQ